MLLCNLQYVQLMLKTTTMTCGKRKNISVAGDDPLWKSNSLILYIAGELGWKVVFRIDSRSRFHGWRPI